MPPRLARLASVPSPGSARGANASTPSRLAAVWAVSDEPITDAVSQGSAATTATPNAAAAHQPARPTGTGHRHADQRHRRGEQQPGRGQPGQRDPEGQPEELATRSPGADPQRQHRRGHPGQAAVADQQAPMPLQQPFGDIGIPDRQGDRDELASRARARAARRRPAAPRPSPPATSPRTSSAFTTTPPSTRWRGQRHREILGRRARRRRQPQRGIGQIRPRRRHRVAQQQIPGLQQRPDHQQRQDQCVPGPGPAHG